MANASDVPLEIWLLIARYLPKLQLSELRVLNSFFFNCWMDIAWRQVMIDTEFPPVAVRLLLRMLDPFVATRTKKLTVCLRHFQTKEELTSSSSSSKLSLSKLASILLPKLKAQPTPTFHTAITHLLQCLPLLPHLTFLKIELWHIPLLLLPTFFQTITTSPLAMTIQKLWLSGHVDMFASLSEYSAPHRRTGGPFGNLTDLNLELINRQFLPSFDGLSVAIIDAPNSICSLALFVLSLSPSLQLLRIWNWSTPLDLWLFFSYLSQPVPDSPSVVPFPNLKSLFLILPFNTSLQSSPQSLHRFLLTHSKTLQHLQLRLKVRRVQLDLGIEETLGTWLADLVHNDSELSPFFPNLRSLDIYPTGTSAGLSAILAIIKRTASTLSSLTIRDRYLTREEAEQVLDALMQGEDDPRVGVHSQVQLPKATTKTKTCRAKTGKEEAPRELKSLRMNVTHLTVSFLDLLAHTHPQLQQLWLSVSDIVGTGQYSFNDFLRYRRYNPDQFRAQDDCLATWQLHDLSIWQAGQKMDDVVRAVADVVPSVVVGSGDDDSSDSEE